MSYRTTLLRFIMRAICCFFGLATMLHATFTHPGVLLDQADLDRIKANVANNVEPWKTNFANFSARNTASINYVMQGPFASVTAAPDMNNTQFDNDASAAKDQAIMWYVTGNQVYANNAIRILNAWSSTLTSLGGSASALLSGHGIDFATAAEIIRYTNGSWSAAGATALENMLKNVFYPNVVGIGDANFGGASLKAIISMAIFTNDQTKFDYAVNQFRTNAVASVTKNNLPIGENSESGRDSPHSAGGIYNLFAVAEMAWKQGVDLYSEGDNRLLAASEYWCAYNLGNNVPYQTFGRASPTFVWTTISAIDRGRDRASAEMAYAHYAVRKGIRNTNYTKQWRDTMELTNYDDLLFFHLSAPLPSAPAVPTNVSATLAGNRTIDLIWSAVSGASSYRIMRNVVGAGWRFGDVVAKGVTGTIYRDAGLAANTIYYYTVSAVSATGESASSSQVSTGTSNDSSRIAVACGSAGAGSGYAETPFEADAYFSGGVSVKPYAYRIVDMSAVSDPAPMRVYELAREGASFSYTIPGLAAGIDYKVRLHFAENYWTTAGSRRFNVSINSTPVLTNYDIYADVGGDFKATIKEFTATANSSGQIGILYTAVNDIALASGIEILAPVSSPTITSQPSSQTLLAGGAATLSITATGSGPLTYQWFLNGNSIPGANLSSYVARASGSYTVTVTNSSGTVTSSPAVLTADPTSGGGKTGTNRLSNISTRSFVGTGDNVQIAGFIISGSGTRTVLIRASGPALVQYGVSGTLADPILSLYSGSTQLFQNDDWSTDAAMITSAAVATGATPFAAGSKDSAIMATLQPGAYTAIVNGKNNGTGVALIEVFEVP